MEEESYKYLQDLYRSMSEHEVSTAEDVRAVAPVLGLRVDDQGYLVDIETGSRVEAACGKPIPISQIDELQVGSGDEQNQIVPESHTQTPARTPTASD